MRGSDECLPRDLPERLGATGEYPEGRLGPDDEGELKVALAADRKARRLILAFGKPVAWIAMTGPEARDFAHRLLEKAKQL